MRRSKATNDTLKSHQWRNEEIFGKEKEMRIKNSTADSDASGGYEKVKA
jgi:hypothetical protein